MYQECEGAVIVEYNLENVEIDRNLTAANVRYFLSNTFINYLAKAGLHKADLSSPKLDLSGVSAHGKNSAENQMFRIFDYENKCFAINSAINNCWENPNLNIRNKTILHDRYIEELTDWQVQQKVGLSGASYREKKRDALCEFADRIEVEACRYDTRIPNLHSYKRMEEIK